MRFDDLSVLDLYFLSRLMGTAIKDHADVLTARLRPFWGEDWKAKYAALSEDFRVRVDRLTKELTEASAALAEMLAFEGRVSAWRDMAADIVRQVENLKKRQHLLRVIGYGAGSPESSKELKDLLQNISKAVAAAKADLAALGMDDEDLAFPARAQEAEEHAADKLASERADVMVARAAMRASFDELAKMLRSIVLAANAARKRALVYGNGEDKVRAEELLARMENAYSAARTESRKRAAEGKTPEELITPVPPTEVVTGTDPDGG